MWWMVMVSRVQTAVSSHAFDSQHFKVSGYDIIIRIHVCLCVCVYVCVYIYIYICIHTPRVIACLNMVCPSKLEVRGAGPVSPSEPLSTPTALNTNNIMSNFGTLQFGQCQLILAFRLN